MALHSIYISRSLKSDQLVVISYSKIELSTDESVPLLATDNQKNPKNLCVRVYVYIWRPLAESHAPHAPIPAPPGSLYFYLTSTHSDLLFCLYLLLNGIYHIES